MSQGQRRRLTAKVMVTGAAATLAVVALMGGASAFGTTGNAAPVIVTNPSSSPVPVTGSVNVGNLPATQPVSGTVDVGNLPATQPVSGTVDIGNLPTSQAVTGTVDTHAADTTTELFSGLICGSTDNGAYDVDISHARDVTVVLTGIQLAGDDQLFVETPVGGGYNALLDSFSVSSGGTVMRHWDVPGRSLSVFCSLADNAHPSLLALSIFGRP